MRGEPQSTGDEESLPVERIRAHREGDAEATARLYAFLETPVRDATRAFLGGDSPDEDDVVQESVLATLDYLRRSTAFRGNLVRFAVVVARNRCRNLHHWRRRWGHEPIDSLAAWIADPARSPLDHLQAAEVREHLHRSLESLDPECRRLLTASYLQSRDMESLKHELGLQTVQGVYYRRQVCLRRALAALKRRLGNCSFEEVDFDA